MVYQEVLATGMGGGGGRGVAARVGESSYRSAGVMLQCHDGHNKASMRILLMHNTYAHSTLQYRSIGAPMGNRSCSLPVLVQTLQTLEALHARP